MPAVGRVPMLIARNVGNINNQCGIRPKFEKRYRLTMRCVEIDEKRNKTLDILKHQSLSESSRV
ncbi:hypothetical protein OUZ56_010604 [Daphnia magna]|uniref:Uncharacterized protein n=1 Tax=Daphnia magna TaxID=35525 RepID=A0ABR0AJ12_9CRUS|nr:hypothetical protein OUZ56_010604 [Daphnia magna]